MIFAIKVFLNVKLVLNKKNTPTHTLAHLKYPFLARNMAHRSSAIAVSEALGLSKEEM